MAIIVSKVLQSGSKVTTSVFMPLATTTLARHLGSKAPDRVKVKDEFPDCVHATEVTVCADVWNQYKDLGYKRYADAPSIGLTMAAEYFDNKNRIGADDTTSTVALIHGSPGTYEHFASVITHLTSIGVRVVMPTFPNLSLTKAVKHFRHSPAERADFAKAVLAEAGVKRLDLVASHSSGTLPLVNLWENQKENGLEIKSMAWLNPIGFDITVPMQPRWFSRLFVKSYQIKQCQFLLDKVGVPLLVKLGNPFAKNGLEDIIWGGCCLHYNDRTKFKSSIEKVAASKVPLLIIFSDNDSVMNAKMNKNLIAACGSTSEDAYIYDRDGKLERVGVYQDRIKLIRSRGGGHFSFIKYPEIVNKAIVDYLGKVAGSSLNQLPTGRNIINNDSEWEEMMIKASRVHVLQ